jgi:four helix bundle protein
MPFLFEKSNQAKLSRGFRDQLSRASLSISLNLAEGNGRWHGGDRRQFFCIARGSVFECIPLLQLLQKRQVLHEISNGAS